MVVIVLLRVLSVYDLMKLSKYLTLTVEFSRCMGIDVMYTFMDGG